MKKICLNMIVKNESHNIERCLKSVAPYISSWVIVDTGSTDNTPQIIEDFFKERNIPGKLHHSTFINFEQARNEALDLARKSEFNFDYFLLIDADMELVVTDAKIFNRLTEHAYQCLQRTAMGLAYQNTRLLKRDVIAAYIGVTHEYLQSSGGDAIALTEIYMKDHHDGSNRVNKGERDLKLLEEGLRSDPANARYVFYIAQSYGGMARLHEARRWYRRRARMGGWDQEVYHSLFQIASISHKFGSPKTHEYYLTAYQYRPTRAEPLIGLALWYREHGDYGMALLYARAASNLPMTDDAHFVDVNCYTWRPMDEIVVAACHVNAWEEGRAMAEKLLKRTDIPAVERARIESNAAIYKNVRAHKVGIAA